MARIPLILSLLCYVFDSEGNFLESQVKLYEKVLEDYPVEWYAKTKVAGQNQTASELTPKQAQQLFASIAYFAFEQAKTFLGKKELLSKIAEYLATISTTKKVDANSLLKGIEAQYGILVRKTEDSYAFAHLTFQEYYAALYIANMVQDGLLTGIHSVNEAEENRILYQPYLTNIYELLIAHFNESELKTLCFNLAIDYESLNAIGKADKARELVRHCLRHDLLQELQSTVIKQRPHISWPESGESELSTQSRLSYLMTHLNDPRWREVILFVSEMLPEEASDQFFEQFLYALQQLIIDDETLLNMLKWIDSRSNKANDMKLKYPSFRERPVNPKPAILRGIYLHLILEFELHHSSLDRHQSNYDYFSSLTHEKSSNYAFIIGYSFMPELNNSNAVVSRFEKHFESAIDIYLKEVNIRNRFFAMLFFSGRLMKSVLWQDMSMPLGSYSIFASNFYEGVHPLLAVDYLLNKLSVVLDILNQVPEAQYQRLLNASARSNIINCWANLLIFSAIIGLPEQKGKLIGDTGNPMGATFDSSWCLTFAQAIESTREYQDLNHRWKLSNEQVDRLYQYLKANWLLIECLNVADIVDREAIENQILLPPSMA
jgi:hypothetical protein